MAWNRLSSRFTKRIKYINIQIVCGGGKVSQNFDPDSILINITPLDDKGCSDLVKASDACILPARQSRVSPGSPLKLYDYILHEKFIISQSNILGYSDEVESYSFGMTVDLEKPKITALELSEISIVEKKLEIDNFSWNTRMKYWIESFYSKINVNQLLIFLFFVSISLFISLRDLNIGNYISHFLRAENSDSFYMWFEPGFNSFLEIIAFFTSNERIFLFVVALLVYYGYYFVYRSFMHNIISIYT